MRRLHEAAGRDPDCSSRLDENAVSCRARRWIGVGVIWILVCLGELAHFVRAGNIGGSREVGVRLGFLLIYIPIHVNVLSTAYDYTLRRRMGPLKTMGLTGGVSMLNAMLLMSCFWAVGFAVPALRTLANAGGELTLAKALAYGAIMGPLHLGVWALAFVYPFAAHDARARALEAEKLKTAAELSRLRGHLEPHFLLNTLNAIAGLCTEDPKEARRLLACLGDLLRDALKDGDEMQTLGEEEAWLRRYAAILESRHHGSLTFRWEIDADVKGVLMPRLLLQPLVENAVKHGALRRRGGGEVVIRATRAPDGEKVVCSVEDNGPGFADRPIRQGALGLNVVRRRLELKYEQARFDIESSTEGTRAVVEFARPSRNSASLVTAGERASGGRQRAATDAA